MYFSSQPIFRAKSKMDRTSSFSSASRLPPARGSPAEYRPRRLEAGESQVEVELLDVLQLEGQEVRVPIGVLGQIIVREAAQANCGSVEFFDIMGR